MNPSVFLLSRLEFRRIDIEVNPEFVPPEEKAFFPQLDFDFNKVKFELSTDLVYPDEEVNDPRHFTVAIKLSIRQTKQTDGVVLPYSVTIDGSAYLHFRGKEEGLSRFKFVRGTAYSMLYSAFREQVATFTARSVHGLWFLPTPNFNTRVEADAPRDVEKWEIAAGVHKKLPTQAQESDSPLPKRRVTKKLPKS